MGIVITTTVHCLKHPTGWMENCTKFVQLILGKMIKILATSCQILRLKCTKFDLGWGSRQTPLGELTALPQPPYLDLWETTSKGRGRIGEGKGRGKGQRVERGKDESVRDETRVGEDRRG